jgi:hypothetical protein
MKLVVNSHHGPTTAGSVLVPVPLVSGVAVTIVDVVGVVPMGDRLVPATLTVRVVMAFVGDVGVRRAFIPMALVAVVRVPVMEIVGVVVVGDSHVAAALTVCMGVIGMGLVGGGGHDWCSS